MRTCRGFKTRPILPLTEAGPAALAPQDRDWDILLTAETHNFPCAVAPYPGTLPDCDVSNMSSFATDLSCMTNKEMLLTAETRKSHCAVAPYPDTLPDYKRIKHQLLCFTTCSAVSVAEYCLQHHFEQCVPCDLLSVQCRHCVRWSTVHISCCTIT